jgi:hypothetical protein
VEEREDTLRDAWKMAEISLNRMSDRSFRTLLKLNGPKAAGHCLSGVRKIKAEQNQRRMDVSYMTRETNLPPLVRSGGVEALKRCR